MNCDFSDEVLALFIGGELSGVTAERVTLHLETCAACRGVAAALEESQQSINALRLDSVNSTILANLHQQVMDRLAVQKRPPGWWLVAERSLFAGFRWKYAFAGASGLIVVLVLAQAFYKSHGNAGPVPPPHSTSIALVSPEETIHSTPADEPFVPQIQHKVQHTRISKRKSSSPATPKEQPRQIMVKLFTDDPSVVIYWSID
jgi:hypothetical protein